MSKKIFFLCLAAVMGIFVYFCTTDTRTVATLPAPIQSQRVSKAFQIMKRAGRLSGKATAQAGLKVDIDEKLAFIAQLRENGVEFVNQQEDYLNGLTDVSASNKANYILTLGNRLMTSAVLTEMSRSTEYSEQLANLLQDRGMRSYITGTMSEYFPVLSRHIEQGGSINGGNLTSMFPDDRDFLSEFDARVASKLDPDYAAAIEAGIADYVASNVLAWQAIYSGELERSAVEQFLWGTPYGGKSIPEK